MGEIDCIHFSSHAVRLGNLDYTAVDSGGRIALSAQVQKDARAPIKEEAIRCVLLHLEAVFGWKPRNSSKNGTIRSTSNLADGAPRQVGYKSALRFVSEIKKPSAQREHDPLSVTHDVMTPNHGHQFREMPDRLPNAFLRTADDVMRIFDIEDSGGGIMANSHGYGEDRNSTTEQDLVLCVWGGRFRFLLPTAIDTSDTWANSVGTVSKYERMGRHQDLDHDESPAMVYALEPCLICKKLTRTPKSNLFSPTGHIAPLGGES